MLIGNEQTHFRLWAPKAREIDVVLEDAASSQPIFYPLTSEPAGYFSGTVNVSTGGRSRLRVNGRRKFVPIRRRASAARTARACSVIESQGYRVSKTSDWPGVKLKGQIIYEMHIGTFTKEGTWRAAAEQLVELARIENTP